LIRFGPGSWLNEAGWLSTRSGQIYAGTWMVFHCFAIASIFARTHKEDEMMREKFGEIWYAWAAKVPYKMFPGLF